MRSIAESRSLYIAALCMFVLTLSVAANATAQRGGRGGGEADSATAAGRGAWDVTLARGKTRDIDFTAAEGTWMSADLSPDGTWLAFDLLGHIYKVPA